MTGAPPAVLAVIRAALTDAQQLGRHTAEDDAQRVIDELAQAGWHITAVPPENAPQQPA